MAANFLSAHTLVLFQEQGGIETTPETLQDEDKKVFSAAGNILKLTPEHSNEE